jgi:cell division protease FtsH
MMSTWRLWRGVARHGGRRPERSNFTAEKILAQWGMSDRVGPINLGHQEEHPFLGREISLPERYSEEMAWVMDQEIRKMIIDA